MNKEKERNMVETSKKVKSEKIEKFFKNYKNIRRLSANNLETRVKALEDTVAALVAEQENKEV